MVRDHGQGFGQFRFGRREGRNRIGHEDSCALDHVRARRSDERIGIVGIGGERAIEKTVRLGKTVRGRTPIQPSQTLKIEVHRVGQQAQAQRKTQVCCTLLRWLGRSRICSQS